MTTLKWYNEHGFKLGEETLPRLMSESAILKTARRKSKQGFSSLHRNKSIAWYSRGKKVRVKTK